MRLKKVKLAGFKSFVDPTSLELRSQLVGIVGPNGCGKSNVIDAVRWVMGESSAKTLRGESMSDVIFNGSSTRKPVGQASVEMIFDNSDGSLGGAYSSYSEISIRREASRDGRSDYFLNNTRCRRRDITDVFLGTGLGSRSYSIIEQGMISRVIEARPDDLRSFLEEAAGISIYKKRRHQTELRMTHTRDNLSRIFDLLEEQRKLVDRLRRQSEAAAQFKIWKSEKEILEGQWYALQWQGLHTEKENYSIEIRALSTQLEEYLAERTRLEKFIETNRLTLIEKQDIFQEIQGKYYDLGTQIARVEQSIEHHIERKNTLKRDLLEITATTERTKQSEKEDREKIGQCLKELEEILPKYESSSTKLELLKIEQEKNDKELKQCQSEFEQFQQKRASVRQTAEVEKARIEHLDQSARESQNRLEKLKEEASRLDPKSLQQEVELLKSQILDKETHQKSHQVAIQTFNENIQEQKQKNKQYQKDLDQNKLELQSHKGRLASLEVLQQAALGKSNKASLKWIENASLMQEERLGQLISVSSGWDIAVETVLAKSLQAICVEDLQEVFPHVPQFQEGSVSILQHQKSDLNRGNANAVSQFTLLSTYVNGPKVALDWLAGIYIASSLTEAFQARTHLRENESFITKEGIWIGKYWIRIHCGDSTEVGILSREEEIKVFHQKIESFESLLEINTNRLTEGQSVIESLEAERDERRRTDQLIQRELAQLASQISAKKTRLEHTEDRLQRIQQEQAELQSKMGIFEKEASQARSSLEQALEIMAGMVQEEEKLNKAKESHQAAYQLSTENYKRHQENHHALSLKRQMLLTEKQGTEQGLNRLLQQLEQAEHRIKTLSNQLNSGDDPEQELRFQLDELLENRLTVERELDNAREEVQTLEGTLEQHEKERHRTDKEVEKIRTELDGKRLSWNALDVRRQTIEEHMAKESWSLETLLKSLPTDVDQNSCFEKVTDLQKKMDKLGAINLAAIEEYQTESERLIYLESQHQDLSEALATLEEAIRKIDKETRSRFKDTFETVNHNFQLLFPKLFGGGQAYLDLTEEDLLMTGISVMARPPGKRNSSIHLLSGGEKALTAIALVFAIFELNPAPFCLLDEVDAPLDDVNVTRFCNLLKHMAESVQFIFITHNKLTMEIAKQLSGVTMKEPGVSRLVSVDVDEAVAMTVT